MLRKKWFGGLVAVLVVINAAIFFWRRSAYQSSFPARSDVLEPPAPPQPLEPPARSPAASQIESPAASVTAVSVPRRRAISLDTALFSGALMLFLLTRFIGLENFPVYFFTDEAIQTVQAASFLHNGFRDSAGILFPTYFQNGTYFNLSASVYAQVLPYELFGYSILITRAVSVLIALSGAAAVGLILKHIFKVRWWWAGTLLLTVTPTFFLHSRTAFETVMGASLYAWYLYFYLRYRYLQPRNLIWAFLFGALCFYAYSPAQVVVVMTSALLLLSDWRYHWQTLRARPRVMVFSLVVLLLLVLPYLRFQGEHPSESYYHLRILDSYWLKQDLTVGDKLKQFVDEYTYGLSPAFWYLPDNGRDLIRHVMKGYGHILLVTLPFMLIGLAVCLRKIRSSMHRAALIALLAAPLGGALVQVQVYRVLSFVVPAALITSIGLIAVLELLLKRIRYNVIAVGLFAVMSVIGCAMLFDAVTNGPRWYDDYDIGGLQYGAQQVFSASQDYLKQAPGDRVNISPTWTNGADVLLSFLAPNEPRLQMGNIDAYRDSQIDLPDNLMFVMTPAEFQRAQADPKFTNIRQVRDPLKYPDGRDGFYFVKLSYSPQVTALFAAQDAERHKPVSETFVLGGEPVTILHSQFDVGQLSDLFDHDTYTLVRSKVDNPLIVELTFPQPRSIEGLTLTTGTMDLGVTVKAYADENGEPQVYTQTYTGLPADPTVTLNFDPAPGPIKKLRLEVKDLNAPSDAHIHIREITLK